MIEDFELESRKHEHLMKGNSNVRLEEMEEFRHELDGIPLIKLSIKQFTKAITV